MAAAAVNASPLFFDDYDKLKQHLEGLGRIVVKGCAIRNTVVQGFQLPNGVAATDYVIHETLTDPGQTFRNMFRNYVRQYIPKDSDDLSGVLSQCGKAHLFHPETDSQTKAQTVVGHAMVVVYARPSSLDQQIVAVYRRLFVPQSSPLATIARAISPGIWPEPKPETVAAETATTAAAATVAKVAMTAVEAVVMVAGALAKYSRKLWTK